MSRLDWKHVDNPLEELEEVAEESEVWSFWR